MSWTCSGVRDATSAARDAAETLGGSGPNADNNVVGSAAKAARSDGDVAVVEDTGAGAGSADAGGATSFPLFRTQMPIM